MSAAIRTRLSAVELGGFYGVEHTFVPIDVSRKEPLADEFVKVMLHLVARGLEFQYDITDLDLATCLDDVEKGALLSNIGEVTILGAAADKDVDAAAHQRQYDKEEQKDEPEQRSRQLDIALCHSGRKPGADRDANRQSNADENQPDGLARGSYDSAP